LSYIARPIHILFFLLLSAGVLSGQTEPTERASGNTAGKLPEFEVATIKPVEPHTKGLVGPVVYPNGKVAIRRTTLKGLIEIAFQLSLWQIAGGEEWMNDTEYNIEAIPPETVSAQTLELRYSNWGIEDQHLRQMLQALLIDRFQLKFHREQRPGTIYLLERSGKPLRLQPTKASPDPENVSGSTRFSGDIGFAGGRWVLFNTSLPQFAKFASDHILKTPVLDRTNLSGSFDYRQSAALSDAEANYSDPSESFLLLIGELGLRLKSSRGAIEAFVIDHADKPSAN
jgi:uncharacterized protein (TIGR03435 family)